MADLERIYVVPLRKARYTPATKRTKRAVSELKQFIARHMKASEEKVWIDGPVNELLWSRGIQRPPSRIRVKAVKFEDDGVVEVSLPEATSERRHGVSLQVPREEETEAAAPEAAEGEAKPAPEAAPAEAEEKPAEAEEKPAAAPAEKPVEEKKEG